MSFTPSCDTHSFVPLVTNVTLFPHAFSPQGLLELNLVPEEWGGNTPMVPISAKKGTGDCFMPGFSASFDYSIMLLVVSQLRGNLVCAHQREEGHGLALLSGF
jgi:hypothetical protein